MSLSYLHIRYNSLTVLREYDLSGLENLKLLMLHSNSIHSIEDRSFQDLKSLQVKKKKNVCHVHVMLKRRHLVSHLSKWSSYSFIKRTHKK